MSVRVGRPFAAIHARACCSSAIAASASCVWRTLSPSAAPGAAGGRAVEAGDEQLLHEARGTRTHGANEALTDLAPTAQRVERRRSHPPGLACRHIASGQCQRPEAAEALPFGGVDPQQFTTPGGAVGAQADAVQRQADDRLIDAMLGHHRRDVGVVVLDADRGNPQLRGQRHRQAGAVEIGVQVVRDRSHRPAGSAQQRLH